MEANQLCELKFDPSKSGDDNIRKIFNDSVSIILWCCIKTRHLVDQNFNDIVLNVTNKINSNFPNYYDEFVKLIVPLTNQYGVVSVKPNNCGFNNYGPKHIDNEFWGQIYEMICNNRHFEYKLISGK